MKKNKKKILIIGLNCGLKTYEYLSSLKNIDTIAVFSKIHQNKKLIAGYIDIGNKIKSDKSFYYSTVKELEKKINLYSDIDMILAIGISDILTKLLNPKIGVLGAHAEKLPQRPGCAR